VPQPIPVIGTLTCPDDSNNSGVPGGLSYAANAGYINASSWTNLNPISFNPVTDIKNPDCGDGAHDSTGIAWSVLSPPGGTLPSSYSIGASDQAIARATGVFWRNEQDGFRMSLAYVEQGDGTSNTLLLAENINSGNWADISSSRFDLQTGFIAFGLCITLFTEPVIPPQPPFPPFPSQLVSTPTGHFGTPLGYLDMQPDFRLTDVGAPLPPNTPPLTGIPIYHGPPPIGALPPHPPDDANLNSNVLTAPNGWTARPSSNHPGIIVFCFVDGHALPLSTQTDSRVYARAISPNGSRCGQAIDGDVR
jgi:hypothetical protein